MAGRQQIQEIPQALKITLEHARAEYGALARKIRWGDGPIFVCGVGECSGFAVAAECALETHLSRPVVARPAEVLLNYGLALLRPHAVLLFISGRGDSPEALELSAAARERGCALIALTCAPESALAKSADHLFSVAGVNDPETAAATVCMHAALNLLPFEVMRVLKKAKPWWDDVAMDFEQLPDKLNWVFTQLSPMIRSVAAELAGAPGLTIVGGGFHQYPAWWSARRIESLSGKPVDAVEPSGARPEFGHNHPRGHTQLFLSGSHSKMKKLIHRCAAQAHSAGARVLSMTDANDRALVEDSDLGILIPELQEAPSSTLALFMLEWLAMEIARGSSAQKQVPANR